jgi:hypothetical protein
MTRVASAINESADFLKILPLGQLGTGKRVTSLRGAGDEMLDAGLPAGGALREILEMIGQRLRETPNIVARSTLRSHMAQNVQEIAAHVLSQAADVLQLVFAVLADEKRFHGFRNVSGAEMMSRACDVAGLRQKRNGLSEYAIE